MTAFVTDMGKAVHVTADAYCPSCCKVRLHLLYDHLPLPSLYALHVAYVVALLPDRNHDSQKHVHKACSSFFFA